MLLLPIYAVIVWYATYRLRRRLLGLVLPILAGGAVLLLLRLIVRMQHSLGATSAGDSLSISLMLYAEAIVVTAVGLFIAVLPRTPAYPHCPYCFYNLTGLDDRDSPDFVCPECGTPAHGYARRRSAAPQPPGDPRQKDHAGGDRQQTPVQPGSLLLRQRPNDRDGRG